MAEPLYKPLGVVPRDELTDDPARLGETLEAMEIEALLLERSHEALDDAITLRLADVRRRDGHPQPLHLVDPRIGDVLWPPVAADPEPASDVFRESPDLLPHALPQRLERGPAIADLRGVPPHELIDAVIDSAEEPAPAVLGGVEARLGGAPHLTGPRGGDRASVRWIAIRRAQAPGREQVMHAHQPQDALTADGQAPMRQARPHLAIPSAGERRRREHSVDGRDDLGIAVRGLGPALGRDAWPGERRRRRPVNRRARHPEDGTDHRQWIAPAGPAAHHVSHRRCFFHSSVSPLFSMRCSASSSRIISSPILARASVTPRSSGSLRVLSPRVPCSRKIRFQLSSSWAGTWLSRDTASSASPGSSRRTNAHFRWTLHRSGSSGSFGGLDGSGGVTGFLGFVSMLGLLGLGHPTQRRAPMSRVRLKGMTALDQAVGDLGFVTAIEVVAAEIVVVDVVLEHVIGGGEHGGGDGEDGFLGAAAALEAEELRAQVPVLFAGGGPGGLYERCLQPRVARARPGGQAFAGTFVETRAEPRPRDEMVMSKPISATRTRATVSLTPGMVISRSR